MQHCRFSTGLLPALQGLTGLVKLKVGHYEHNEESRQSLEAVCQLTGLRELRMMCPSEEGLLLQLAQLKQLTRLEYEGITDDYYDGCVILTKRVSGLLKSGVVACLLCAGLLDYSMSVQAGCIYRLFQNFHA
jgi:hypothetical protein